MNEIFIRRSVRRFKEKQVEKEKISKLIRAGMQAPSAMNQQPWEIMVIQDKETLKEIAKHNEYAGCLKYVNLAIVVLGNMDKSYKKYANQDLSAATQNILLEAVSLDLGTVWIGVDEEGKCEEKMIEILNLPKNIKPFNIIAVGYPEKDNANYFIDRFDENKVHYEKYNK